MKKRDHLLNSLERVPSSLHYAGMLLLCGMIFCVLPAAAQEDTDSIGSYELDDFTLLKRKPAVYSLSGPETGVRIGQQELFKAACCNLGESFTTNPSVDVDYADPVTGARQIRLLGLAGSYVQMMTENMPAFRGAAAPYGFRYVPGPWMKSIRISKGASTVKNGFEAITGQIDVEYLKPQDEQGATINAYFDSELKGEFNATGNVHLTNRLNSALFAHYEQRYQSHDGNDDGFADSPAIRQFNFMNRWNYFSDSYIMHAGASALFERSRAGQIGHHSLTHNPFLINLDTRRYEAYMKHAFIINKQHSTNIAFTAGAAMHELESIYGVKSYDVNEKNINAQLMFETEFSPLHKLSAGLSMQHDYLSQHLRFTPTTQTERIKEKETVGGAYAQYTLSVDNALSLMAGVRADIFSQEKLEITPRLNVKYSPVEGLAFRASAGRGLRRVHPWAEYNNLLASGRSILIADKLPLEKAWTFGGSAEYSIPISTETLKLNAEYFFTSFTSQVVVDYETPGQIIISNPAEGHARSHTFQVDATYTSSFGLSATLAYRLNDASAIYGGQRLSKPLTSKYKALASVSYSTPLELWQFDATFVLNGGGRMPTPYMLPDGNLSWDKNFKAFPSLNLQATRWFRHFSIYAGGENLTNFRQKNPIVWAAHPWSENFDPTVIWGPVHGAMAYVGIRVNLGRI